MELVAERIWTLLEQARSEAPESERLREAQVAYNDYGNLAVNAAWLVAFFTVQEFAGLLKEQPDNTIVVQPSWTPTATETILLGGRNRATQCAQNTWKVITATSQEHPQIRAMVNETARAYKGSAIYVYLEWAVDALTNADAHAPGSNEGILDRVRSAMESFG